jgi:crotonobetainyl-CoA:carnitine CoA-transferase CaiB-like acyl-CoA transferase
MSGALKGLRIVEVGHIIAGPFCGHLFADHGAEVVKVEPPGTGDPMRKWGGLHQGVGLYWPLIARGKKSVTLDLHRQEGRHALRELLRTADVVIENFRPGRFESWGLGWDELEALNPGLVMVRISGFGQTGPYRDRAGFGSVAEAMSGFRYLCGEPGRPPVRVGVSIGDALAGTQGFVGAMLALYSRDRRGGEGRGQVVDVGLYEAMWMYMESLLPEYEILGETRQPSGPLLPGIAPSNVYPTADGKWVVMGANGDAVFARLAGLMGRPQWIGEDSPYRTHETRGANQVQLDGEIAEWTITRENRDLLEALRRAGVPAGPIYTAADIATDPQYAARDMVISVPEPNLGGQEIRMQGIVPKLSRTPGSAMTGAPLLGQHNEEIWGTLLGEGGLDRLQSLAAV